MKSGVEVNRWVLENPASPVRIGLTDAEAKRDGEMSVIVELSWFTWSVEVTSLLNPC